MPFLRFQQVLIVWSSEKSFDIVFNWTYSKLIALFRHWTLQTSNTVLLLVHRTFGQIPRLYRSPFLKSDLLTLLHY